MTAPGWGLPSTRLLLGILGYATVIVTCFYSAYYCIYIVIHCSVAEAVPVYDQSHPQPIASVPVVPVCLYILV